MPAIKLTWKESVHAATELNHMTKICNNRCPSHACKNCTNAIQKHAAHHMIVAMTGFKAKFVNRFSVFAQWLSIKHLLKTKFAQFWTSVVTPGFMQQGKQHHGLSIEDAGSEKLYISSLPSAVTNACVAGNLAQVISRTRILVFSRDCIRSTATIRQSRQFSLAILPATVVALVTFNTSVTANAPQGKLLRSGQAASLT